MTPEEPVHVLVVDDDPALARAMKINLEARGYRVTTTPDAASALRAVTELDVDLVLLDLGLPDRDGLDVVVGVRGWSQVPIVVLSARHTTDDKVEALDAGADDYVTKPFEMHELLARIRAALRHSASEPTSPVLEVGELVVDLRRSTVTRAGEVVRLTPKEWALLEVLARRPGELVTQAELLAEVWGPGYERETHYLRVYLATLRRKLEPEPAHPRHLLTEPGRGYRLALDPPRPEPGAD